jgi:23S rRNA pseudouridine1911/1915/1917 synthase
VIEEQVPPALAGQRVDRVVALVAEISRSAAARLIEVGGVQVDGTVVSSGKERLRQNQVVAVDPTLLPTEELPTADPGVEVHVVHADADVIVVDKPAGLVVHPGAGHLTGTLVNGLLARYPDLADVGDPMRPGIVHRLDAGTSGLLVVARTQRAYNVLVSALSERSVTRRYTALVWGHPDQAHGLIDAPIGRDPRDPLRMAVVADGRPARTRYDVRRRFGSPIALALLDCQLETGRTHQIRVHLAAIGHPVVGDVAYGRERPTLGLQRPFLHATSLSFDHPAGSGNVTVDSPLAPDLTELLDQLA